MPYYASAELQLRHGADLKRFLTGTSCLEFRGVDDLPLHAIVETFQTSSASYVAAKQALHKGR